MKCGNGFNGRDVSVVFSSSSSSSSSFFCQKEKEGRMSEWVMHGQVGGDE